MKAGERRDGNVEHYTLNHSKSDFYFAINRSHCDEGGDEITEFAWRNPWRAKKGRRELAPQRINERSRRSASPIHNRGEGADSNYKLERMEHNPSS